MTLPRLKVPLAPLPLALVTLAFVVPGLWHELWKSQDAISIAVVHGMARNGDWLVPRVAGQPWLADPPLYYWVSLGFAKLFGELLPFHDAARLASGALVIAAMWLLARAAHAAALPEERRAGATGAALLLIGSIGLMVHAHEAVPELAALTAICAAFACLAGAQRAPLAAGIGFGASLAAAFLANGPRIPLALAAAALLGHLVCDAWRTRRGVLFLAATVATCAPLAASWPLALEHHAPGLFTTWWHSTWRAQGAFWPNLEYFASIVGWFTWPAWPLALWGIWAKRWRWREPSVVVPFAAFVFLLVALACFGPPEDVGEIALLPPLVLLAAQGIATLRRGAANALDWFGIMTFTFFTGLVWLGYGAMLTGVPPRIANDFARQAPSFEPHFAVLPCALALALLAGWIYLLWFTPRAPTRSVTRWAAGVALLWGTVATLWMPWVDYQKGYDRVALAIKAKLPAHAGCIARRNIGMPQRAALSYYAGIRTRPYLPEHPSACKLLLVTGPPGHAVHAPGAGWVKLVEIGRPGDSNERFRLYRYVR